MSRILLLLLLLNPATPADSVPIRLGLVPGTNAAKDPRTIAIVDHPCGSVAVARVTKLPLPGKQGPLISEVAIERNPSTGAALRRWPMPVDSIPKALHGDKLLLQLVNDNRMFWVTPQGAIAPTNKPPATSHKEVPCPRKTSDYTVCRELPDLTSGRSRLIEFEAPCT